MFLRGFFLGLLNVLFFSTPSMDLVITEEALGVKTFLLRMWTFGRNATRTFEQFTNDTWTLFLYNGAVITIQDSELTSEQVEHFQSWVVKPQNSEHEIFPTKTPELENVLHRKPVVCFVSKARVLGFLGLTSLMFGVFYLLTMVPRPVAQVIGWIGVSLFSLGFIAFPLRLLQTRPQVVIDDEGIEDHRLKVGVIRWADIRSIYNCAASSVKFLGIELIDPELFFSRLPRRKRWLGAGNRIVGLHTPTINFGDLNPGLKQVWDHLKDRGAVDNDSLR